MSIDLLLIHPGAQHGIYGKLGDTLTALEPPTWTRMIAGWLIDRGYSVQIVDQEAEHLSSETVADQAQLAMPRLVAIIASGHQPSASSQQMVSAGAVARAVKAKNPDQRVAMLGNHPSALPVRTLQEEAADFVCDGEGPLTLKGLLDGDALPDIPGLVWNDGGSARQNNLAPLIPIDELHGDVWNLLPMNLYRAHQWQCFGDLSKRQPYASIYTTLGCAFSCSFCMINVFQHTNRYRRRDPKKVVEQIVRLYRDYGVKTIKFADEMFVLSRHHVTAICEGLIKSGIADDINWWSYARVDSIFPDLLALMRRAGCQWLALGIESGSKYVRDGAQKRLKNDDIIGVVRAIQAANINVIGNFIYGLPDDSIETMQETLDLSLELNCEFMNAYCAMAYPGSALYDQAIKEGWTLPSSWSGFSQHNSETRPLDTRYVDAATVLKFRDEAFTTYFTNPRYLEMIERKFGAETRAHVEQMTKYKLKRKLTEAA
jgi:anaerobic magnesium-protoporphyrin IX monomethyl ester cyclase